MSAVLDKQNFIGGVNAADILRVWDLVEPILKRVVRDETGENTLSVLTDLQLSKRQLWVINDFEAVVVTAILDRPVDRILHVPFIAGDNMKDWIDDWRDTMEAYARENKCDAIEFNGRRGWNKIGEGYPEYRPLTTIFRREL